MYKIGCKDEGVPDCYVGHSTNIRSRKAEHKYNCCNENSKSYNIKVYDYIRANGGWDNWEMIEIEQFPCETKKQAEVREHFWCYELKSTLNTISPILNIENIKQQNKLKSDQAKEATKIKVEARKQERLVYLEENKEAIADHKRKVRIQYTADNKEIINEKMREYNQQTSEALAIRNKKYYEARKQKGYYEANKEKNKAYYEANKDKIKAQGRARYNKVNKQ